MTFELDENGYHFENQAYTQTLSTKAIKLLDNDKRIIIELVDHMNYLKGEGKVFHELNNNCKDYAASAWKQIVLKNQN